MEQKKTQIHAEEGKQDLIISRDFELPLELLYRAYTEADIISQWMGTQVVQLDNKTHGSYRFETSNPEGTIVFSAHGTIHELVPEQRIIRTFEMEQAPIGVQLEILDFEALGEERSRLRIQVIYRSPAHREQQLKMPFAYGLNMAHDRLQEVLHALK